MCLKVVDNIKTSAIKFDMGTNKYVLSRDLAAIFASLFLGASMFGTVAFVFAIVALSAVLVSVICMLCFRKENNC